MVDSLPPLVQRLTATADFAEAHKAIDDLVEHARKGRAEIDALLSAELLGEGLSEAAINRTTDG